MTNDPTRAVLVTGASRGIGRATAFALASMADLIIVHYGNAHAQADGVVEEIKSTGTRAIALQANLANLTDVRRLAVEISSLAPGGLNGIVLNAGVSKAAPFEEHDENDFDDLFSTNVKGPFFLLQKLMPLLHDGSSVVVVTSVVASSVLGDAGLDDSPSLVAYAATKGALETLVRHWASLLGPKGIRVNAVAPGIVETDMSNFTKTAMGRKIAIQSQALKRIGQPEEIADVISFLISKASRWITGAIIPADGGTNL